MRRFAGAELAGTFTEPLDVDDQRVANESPSAEALWQPLDRLDFQLVLPSSCAGRWRALEKLAGSGAEANPAMRGF